MKIVHIVVGKVNPDSLNGVSKVVHWMATSQMQLGHDVEVWGLTESTKEFAQEYQTVTVVTPDGHEIKGVTLNEDQFSLQMMDTAERVHLFEKDKLLSIQKSRDSLMPVYNSTILSDQDLDDIVAYLLSVGAK